MAESLHEEYAAKRMEIVLVNTLDINVWVDPVQLQTGLTNILENSVKYSDKEQGRIEVECADNGEFVTVSLTDNGPGVPEDSLTKLFDVFYRSDPSRQNPSKGSGLGLAITAKIMARMNGSIRAENALGGGLRIILTLPKYYDEEGRQT